MNKAIKCICAALVSEANAVMDNTERIVQLSSSVNNREVIRKFDEIRLKEIENIQLLCIELTKQFVPETSLKGGENEE